MFDWVQDNDKETVQLLSEIFSPFKLKYENAHDLAVTSDMVRLEQGNKKKQELFSDKNGAFLKTLIFPTFNNPRVTSQYLKYGRIVVNIEIFYSFSGF